MNDVLLHVTAAVVSVAIVLAVTKAALPGTGKKAYFFLVLAALGFYFFPLGAIEAYDFTRLQMNLSEAKNAVLWYIISTSLIVIGILGLRRTP